MNSARVMLTISERLFLDTENSLAAGIRGYTATVGVRRLDPPSRPAKGRSSLNGALGMAFTGSPLESAAASVPMLQPGWGRLC